MNTDDIKAQLKDLNRKLGACAFDDEIGRDALLTRIRRLERMSRPSPITFDRAHFEQQCQDVYRATMYKRRPTPEDEDSFDHLVQAKAYECFDLLLEIAVLIGSHGPRFNVEDDHGEADIMRLIRTNAAMKKWCLVTGNSVLLDICHRAEEPFQQEARQAVLDSFAELSPMQQREARWLTSDSAPVWE